MADPDVLKAKAVAVETQWPNYTYILETWLPKSTIMIYTAENESYLVTLLSRLSSRWINAPRLTFKQWFDLPDSEKSRFMGKHLILLNYQDFKMPSSIPSNTYFLTYSSMFEVNGAFKDIQDKGWQWGLINKGITSNMVLNGEHTIIWETELHIEGR